MTSVDHLTSDELRPSAILSWPARLRLLADQRLGVGNFLDKARAVARHPESPFLWAQRHTDSGSVIERYGFTALVEIRDAYAAWYHDAGVRKGDPVGVYLGDGVDPLLNFLGLTALGAIPALINGRMPPTVAVDYLRRVGAVGLTADRTRLHSIHECGQVPEGLRFTVETTALPHRREPGSILPAVFPYEHADDDLVMLCHTSGTTGAPKAATFGHRQFFLGKRARLVRFPAARNNRMLSALPQTHSAGISYLMTAILLGMPTFVSADPSGESVRQAMRQFDPTIVTAFPQTYAELAQLDLGGYGAGHIHTWINTGDSAHEAHVRALVRHGRRPRRGRPSLSGSRFVDGLGSSEMGMALFKRVSDPETHDYGRCIGKPVGIVDHATVFDDEGRQLGPGRPGRLGVRTPTVTPGYWNGSQLTTRSSLYGYWLTGDVVYRDEQGRFFHLDRTSDVIHTATGAVHSLPMEEAILVGSHLVEDCAVIAVTDPSSPEHTVPFATVKLSAAATEPADLVTPLNEALTTRGLPRLHGAVAAKDGADFPVGATGKALKRMLRERFADVLAPRKAAGIETSGSL